MKSIKYTKIIKFKFPTIFNDLYIEKKLKIKKIIIKIIKKN